MRTCTLCYTEKPLEQFAKAKQCKDGLRSFCKKCASDKAVAWDRANPEKAREREARRRLKRYGIPNLEVLGTPECQVCKSTERLSIDHDHDCCGKNKACADCVRGWLCGKCNTALGLLDDSYERVYSLMEYARKTKHIKNRLRSANG